MGGYEADTYGERWAPIYDEWVAEQSGRIPGPDDVVPVLVELAGEGPALELAIGTGRIAIPLAERGIEVHGVDASPAMVDRLREKPGGDRIAVAMGDFADVPVDGTYRLIYVVFNTMFALRSQEEQVRCFTNVARHLTGDGSFVMEAFFPDMTLYDRGQRVDATAVRADSVQLTVSRIDPVNQRVESMLLQIEDGRVGSLPVQLRYAWPSELDLMARLAGMRLRDRWGGWGREPFTSTSTRHVSVYELDPARR